MRRWPDNGEVWRRLKTVPYPGYRCDIVSFRLVREVRVEDPAATIVLAIGHLDDATATAITDGVRSAATAAGVTSITLRITGPEGRDEGRPIALDLASPAGRALRNAAEAMHHHLVPTPGRAAS